MGSGQVRLVDLIDDMCAGKDVFFRWVRLVKDIMNHNVKTLTLDDTVETCLKFMKDNDIRHVPIVDNLTESGEGSNFAGIISKRDISRQISPYLGKIGEEDTDSRALRQTLARIVTRKPKSASPETPIPEMIVLMVNSRVDALPVLSDGSLVGIVTAADIVKTFLRLNAIRQLYAEPREAGMKKRLVELLSGGADGATIVLSSLLQTVEDVMTETVVALEEHDNLSKAMEVMQRGKFRHLPIVDSQKRLVGIVSDRDILHHLPFQSKQCPREADTFRSGLFDVSPDDPKLKLSLKKVMTTEVVHILPESGFYDAVEILHTQKISCLPIVDEGEKLRGIITVTDVMRGLLAAYSLIAKSEACPAVGSNPTVGFENRTSHIVNAGGLPITAHRKP